MVYLVLLVHELLVLVVEGLLHPTLMLVDASLYKEASSSVSLGLSSLSCVQ